MAKIYFNDRMLNIESEFTMEELRECSHKTQREERTPLNLYDVDGDPVFTVAMATPLLGDMALATGGGSIAPEVILFTRNSLNTGKALATSAIPGDSMDEVRENAYQYAGAAFQSLLRVEGQIREWKATESTQREAFFRALNA